MTLNTRQKVGLWFNADDFQPKLEKNWWSEIELNTRALLWSKSELHRLNLCRSLIWWKTIF